MFLVQANQGSTFGKTCPINGATLCGSLYSMLCNNMKLPSENAGHGIHHPVYGVKMKEKADRLGHECHLLIDGVSKSEKYAGPTEFLTAKLLAP